MTEDQPNSHGQPVYSDSAQANKAVGSDLQLVLGNIQLLNSLVLEVNSHISTIARILDHIISQETKTTIGN